MSDNSPAASVVTDPRLQAAWREYLLAVDRGEVVDTQSFVARHDEVADELRSLIEFDVKARQLGKGNAAGIAHAAEVAANNVHARPKAEVSTHSVVGSIEQTAGGTPKQAAPSVATPRQNDELTGLFGGRYQVRKKLGSGAMGAVYLAEDSLLQRDVALKTPTFEHDEDGELLKRFYREARAVSKLKHNNLCAVYDVGEFDGRHYISMEYVSGKKLTDFIKPDKPMTEKQAMAVVRKIAIAMHEAHSHGVIHRDLKPDNIMVNAKGEPVVMDFGLVHKTESKDSTKLTQHGTLIGSPAYMSKEQVEGDPDKLTGATDQYSLGVILYQLLTSKLPFEGGLHAVLGAILTKEPPAPSQHRPDLNPHLEAVCLKMMAKEAGNRYPSMKAAADALAAVARGTSTTAGASLVVRPKGGASDAALETRLEPDPSRGAADEFDFNAPNESPRRRKSSRRGPSLPLSNKLIGGLAAGFVLLAAIIFVVIGDSRVKVEILAEGYEVKFNEAEITITDGTRETKVKPGDHTLHIKSSKPGDNGATEEFDTEKLTFKTGSKPVLIVTREDSETVVKLDDKPIPRKSLTVSSTGQSNAGTKKVPDANEKTLIYETSGELIKNGSGADAGPGGLVGWKVLSGQWDKTYVWWKGKAPDHFAVGDVPSGTMEQDVDVSQFADSIDRGDVELKLSWKLRVSDDDIGRLEMIPLDGGRKELGAAYDSGWQDHRSSDWKRFVGSILPVKGVRYVRARLSSKLSPRPGNVESSAYVREISIRAVVKQPFTAPQMRVDGPVTPDAPKAATVQSPDPSGAIDLLAAVDVSQLGDSDMKWERRGQTVVCTGTGAAGKSAWKGFRLPTEIGDDYEVELEFQQRAFWPMQIDFPLRDTAVRVSLTGDSCDLMIENDKSQPNAEKTWRSTATKLKTMVPHKLVVRVRQSGTRAEIEATLDGVKLGTYSGERSRIVLPSWVKPNVKQITSGSLCGNLADGYIELRKAVYRPLSRVSPELVGVSPFANSSPPASPPKAPPQAGSTVLFPQDGRFTAARSLTEVNQGAPINAHPRIASDGLSLYWTREAAGVGSTVMQATRPTTDAPFSAIKPVLQNARLASVSPDGKEIACAFDANGDGKPDEFCTSRRATTSEEFPKPQVIPSMTGLHHALGSTFAEHGNTIIVLAAPQPNTTRVYFRASRSGSGAAWGVPQRVTIPNTPTEMDRLTIPSLTSGGKHLIFAYQDPTNRPVEWGCVADATSDPLVFANPRHLLLDGERFVVRGGTYCPATGELFYTHTGTTPPFAQSEIRVARAEK